MFMFGSIKKRRERRRKELEMENPPTVEELLKTIEMLKGQLIASGQQIAAVIDRHDQIQNALVKANAITDGLGVSHDNLMGQLRQMQSTLLEKNQMIDFL